MTRTCSKKFTQFRHAVACSFLTLNQFLVVTSDAFSGLEDIVVENSWARASIGANRPGVAYMTLRNAGNEPIKLVGLETPLALKPDIHETKIDASGVSTMRPAGELTIASGERLSLQPGGLHVMLMGLQKPMIKGEVFSLSLKFADGEVLVIDVPILGIGARGPEG